MVRVPEPSLALAPGECKERWLRGPGTALSWVDRSRGPEGPRSGHGQRLNGSRGRHLATVSAGRPTMTKARLPWGNRAFVLRNSAGADGVGLRTLLALDDLEGH